MNLLQHLISEEMANGKSYRKIGEKCSPPINHVSISQYHRGEVAPDGKNLAVLSKYFNVNFEDLLDEYKKSIDKNIISFRSIPVISKVQAGDCGFWEDCYPVGCGIDKVECPASIIDPHAFALKVEGDSMLDRYKNGEIVIVDTTKKVINGDDVVVKLTDGAVLIKQYRLFREMVFLHSYNSAYEDIPILDGDIECCFKIVYHRVAI